MSHSHTGEFGTRLPGRRYVNRPGAYAIIIDSLRRVATVRSGDRYFLPGGGIEVGEGRQGALVRETLEETGWKIRPEYLVCRADEVVSIPERDLYTVKEGWFFRATIVGPYRGTSTGEHEAFWQTLGEFQASTAHRSHHWAARQALEEVRSPGSRR